MEAEFAAHLCGFPTAGLPNDYDSPVLLHQVEDLAAVLQVQRTNINQVSRDAATAVKIILLTCFIIIILTLKMGSLCRCCAMLRLMCGL